MNQKTIVQAPDLSDQYHRYSATETKSRPKTKARKSKSSLTLSDITRPKMQLSLARAYGQPVQDPDLRQPTGSVVKANKTLSSKPTDRTAKFPNQRPTTQSSSSRNQIAKAIFVAPGRNQNKKPVREITLSRLALPVLLGYWRSRVQITSEKLIPLSTTLPPESRPTQEKPLMLQHSPHFNYQDHGFEMLKLDLTQVKAQVETELGHDKYNLKEYARWCYQQAHNKLKHPLRQLTESFLEQRFGGEANFKELMSISGSEVPSLSEEDAGSQQPLRVLVPLNSSVRQLNILPQQGVLTAATNHKVGDFMVKNPGPVIHIDFQIDQESLKSPELLVKLALTRAALPIEYILHNCDIHAFAKDCFPSSDNEKQLHEQVAKDLIRAHQEGLESTAFWQYLKVVGGIILWVNLTPEDAGLRNDPPAKPLAVMTHEDKQHLTQEDRVRVNPQHRSFQPERFSDPILKQELMKLETPRATDPKAILPPKQFGIGYVEKIKAPKKGRVRLNMIDKMTEGHAYLMGLFDTIHGAIEKVTATCDKGPRLSVETRELIVEIHKPSA